MESLAREAQATLAVTSTPPAPTAGRPQRLHESLQGADVASVASGDRRLAPYVCMLLLLFVADARLHALPLAGRCRGKLLRSEVVRTNRRQGFRCRLTPSSGSAPRLLFRRFVHLTLHEVPVYEVLLEYKTPGETDPSKIVYKPANDEVLRGQESTRVETVDLGPLAEQTFVINGVAFESDADGIVVDEREVILALFDELSVRKAILNIVHAELGIIQVAIEREMMQKKLFVDPSESNAPTNDVLEALGIDFTTRRRPDRQGLRFDVSCPKQLRPGETFQMTLEAENTGAEPACCIIGRTVSRHAWLGGRNFYLGSLDPGETRSFTRQFTVPEDSRLSAVFGVIGLWDILGAIAEENIPLRCGIGSAGTAR